MLQIIKIKKFLKYSINNTIGRPFDREERSVSDRKSVAEYLEQEFEVSAYTLYILNVHGIYN